DSRDSYSLPPIKYKLLQYIVRKMKNMTRQTFVHESSHIQYIFFIKYIQCHFEGICKVKKFNKKKKDLIQIDKKIQTSKRNYSKISF
ncbi:hypothetical protein, partial [Methanosarcina sp.]|uniref:hypothetical protein n=1 Tax=Methanosarcina sp. TaxID=2213 RepID=UPI002AB8B868